MNEAINETERRRKIQEEYNEKHNITPKTIIKEIHDVVTNEDEVKEQKPKKLSKKEREKLIISLEKQMREAARNLDFEKAVELRDAMFELQLEDN